MEPTILLYLDFPRDRNFDRKVYKAHRDIIRKLSLCDQEMKLAETLSKTYGFSIDVTRLCVGLLGDLFRQGVAMHDAISLYTLGESCPIDIPIHIRREFHRAYRSSKLLYVRLTLVLCSHVNKTWLQLGLCPLTSLDLLYRDDTSLEDIVRDPLFEVLTLCYFYSGS